MAEDLPKGVCGHEKEFLFKCPIRRDNTKCVQCIICLIQKGSDSCSSIMGDRPDYDSLPEIPLDIYNYLIDTGQKVRKYESNI